MDLGKGLLLMGLLRKRHPLKGFPAGPATTRLPLRKRYRGWHKANAREISWLVLLWNIAKDCCVPGPMCPPFARLDTPTSNCQYYKPESGVSVAREFRGSKAVSSLSFRAFTLPVSPFYSTDAGGVRVGTGLWPKTWRKARMIGRRARFEPGAGPGGCAWVAGHRTANTYEGRFLHFGAIGRSRGRAQNRFTH